MKEWDIFMNSFGDLWFTIAMGLPRVLLAVIVFIIGWMISKLVFKAIVKICASLKLDTFFQPTGIARAIEHAGYKLNIGRVLGYLVKWFIIIVFLMTSLDILGLQSTRIILAGILNYIPQVIVAIFILFIAVILGDFVKKVIKGSTKILNFKASALLGNIARISILVFALLLALDVLNIGREIVMIVFIAAVSMISLAGGLAFGLGGRDAAARAIEKAQKELNK